MFLGRGEVGEHIDKYDFDLTTESTCTSSGIEIPRLRSIVRTDTNQVVGCVKSNYKVLTHKEAIDPIIESLSKNHDVFKRIFVTDSGSKMFANLYLKDANTTISQNDGFWPGVSIVNSLDGSLKYRAEATIFRLICTNGLRVPVSIKSFVQLHSKNSDLSVAIEDFFGNFENTGGFSRLSRLAVTPVKTQNELQGVLESVFEDKKLGFPKKYSQRVSDELNIEKSAFGLLTYWNVYNAFNSVIEHDILREQGKIERARLLDENLFSKFYEFVK